MAAVPGQLGLLYDVLVMGHFSGTKFQSSQNMVKTGLLPISESFKAGLERMQQKVNTTRREREGSGCTTNCLLHRVVHLSLMFLSLGDLPRSLGQIFLYNSVPTNAKSR